MDNRLSILLFTAIIGYVIFCLIKYRKIASPQSSKCSNNYCGLIVIGMLLGLMVGFFSSPILTQVIFTDNFLKTHSNPDIGLFGYYISITFALTVLGGILPVIMNGYFAKNTYKTNNRHDNAAKGTGKSKSSATNSDCRR